MNYRIFFIFLALTGVVFACSQNEHQIKLLDNPASENSQLPYLFSSGNTLYMSWISAEKDGNTLNYARYTSGSWSKVHTIASSSTWVVNWADFPSIIADDKKPIAAHWLNNKPGGFHAYDVNITMAKSSDQWSEEITPHLDNTATEHGFVSMIPWNDSAILAVWLDGRRTADRSENEYQNMDKAMTLRGAIISTEGEIKKKFLIDDAVCDCCQTSLVKTANGAIVAYRNRTEDEIRDIYLSRFDGNSWSDPKVVHQDGWKIGACPVNGPKLAAADSTVVVTWHTAADNNPTVKAAISTDGGNNFEDPVSLNKQESLGRVDAAIHNNKAYVSWMEKSTQDEEKANLKVAAYGINENAPATNVVSQINSSRQTGFPQMEVVDNELIFAWTKIDSAKKNISTKKASLPL